MYRWCGSSMFFGERKVWCEVSSDEKNKCNEYSVGIPHIMCGITKKGIRKNC